MPNPKEPWLERRTVSVTELAHVLGVSRSLAYELVTQKRIRSVRINRRIVITRSAIDEFLANHE